MKLVFCGTPAFAVPTLEAVLAAGHEVALVLTQPDRPQGRAAVMTAPAVKLAALTHGLRVMQPEKLKNNAELQAELKAIEPEAILIVAYGRIIPQWMLELPRHGNLNLHGSLLPKYRGAAPIQWAIARGETVTGVTTMRIDAGLDTGDILLQSPCPIPQDATAEEMYPLLAELGAQLMIETLAGLTAGTITPRKQDDAEATLAPILTREDALVNWRAPAKTVYDRWRGFQPWPGAYTFAHGKKLTLYQMRLAERAELGEAGVLQIEAGHAFVCCGDGWIELLELQLEGKKRLAAAEFLRGAGWTTGERFG